MLRLVDSAAVWATVAPTVRAAPRLALDIESDGFHRFPEQLSLIQLGLPDGTLLLLDPLALSDMSDLGAALADPDIETVVHSASHDVRTLDRDLGFVVHGLFDTAIGAQLLGATRTGLANVLADVLGVNIPKPKHLQRHDWSKRPLAPDALEYAASDVAYLLDLAVAIQKQLAALDREGWAEEESRRLAATRYDPPAPPEEGFLSVKGARDLSEAERAVLREVFVFRHAEALRIGRPPHYVMSNEALLGLARNPDADLDRVGGIRRRTLAKARRRLSDALARGRTGAPVRWPRGRQQHRWSAGARDRLATLKAWRRREADTLGLAVGTIWPAIHLERIALYPDRALDDLDEGEPPWVRAWQQETLGPSLEHFVGTTLRG